MVKTPTLLDLTIILVLCGVLLDILKIKFDADGASVKKNNLFRPPLTLFRLFTVHDTTTQYKNVVITFKSTRYESFYRGTTSQEETDPAWQKPY